VAGAEGWFRTGDIGAMDEKAISISRPQQERDRYAGRVRSTGRPGAGVVRRQPRKRLRGGWAWPRAEEGTAEGLRCVLLQTADSGGSAIAGANSPRAEFQRYAAGLLAG